jgi:Zn-dependent metalloprotease
MNYKYGCRCFALPHAMLAKIALRAEADERESMLRCAEHSARIRAGRHDFTPSRGSAATPALAKQLAVKRPAESADLTAKRRIFDAAGQESLPGNLVRDDGIRKVKDAAVNEAYRNAGIALDFFRRCLGRNSIDDRGMQVDSSVHVGQDYPNAMWTGTQMLYGDGNSHVSGFTSALDIIAHELAHGITQHSVPGGLGMVKIAAKDREYKFQKYDLRGQSGALNESFSDVFGSLVKQWHRKQDVKEASWLMGEHLLAGQHGHAIRSLKDPGNRKLTWYDDEQARDMDGYVEGGDVHDNSGIPNRAFYLAAEAIGGKAWKKAGPIWYAALPMLSSDATFADAARATGQAATQRFGARSKEVAAVTKAWRAVKVMA